MECHCNWFRLAPTQVNEELDWKCRKCLGRFPRAGTCSRGRAVNVVWYVVWTFSCLVPFAAFKPRATLVLVFHCIAVYKQPPPPLHRQHTVLTVTGHSGSNNGQEWDILVTDVFITYVTAETSAVKMSSHCLLLLRECSVSVKFLCILYHEPRWRPKEATQLQLMLRYGLILLCWVHFLLLLFNHFW